MEARSTIGDCRFKDWRAGNCDRSQILSIAQALSIFLHRVVVWGAIARGTDTTRGDRQQPEKLNYSSYSRFQAYEVLSISPVGTRHCRVPTKARLSARFVRFEAIVDTP